MDQLTSVAASEGVDVERGELDLSQSQLPDALPQQPPAGECPLSFVVIRHISGQVEEVRPEQLSTLQIGSAVLVQPVLRVAEAHYAMPTPLYLIPGTLENWGSSEQSMFTLEFATRSYVYVLLPSLTREPLWLRDLFTKHRDPATSVEVTLKARRRYPLSIKAVMLLSGQYERTLRQTIRVFRSKRCYEPGEQLVVAGPGLALMTDMMFSLAVSHEADTNHVLMVKGKAAGDAAESSALAFEELDFDLWQSRLIKAVKRNRLDDVKRMLLSGAWVHRLPSQSSVTYLPPGSSEEDVLLVDLAVKNGNLAMLCVLLTDYACGMGYKALKFLVHHFEEVPSQYGGARGMMLTYLARMRRSPLACTSAFLMALRAEIRQRDRVSPSQDLQSAADSFHKLQIQLLNELLPLQLMTDAERQARRLPSLFMILDGGGVMTGPPTEICQFRPLRVAFEDRDAAFFLSPTIASYRRQCWVGVDFALETQKDGVHEMSMLNPCFLHLILSNLGFAGPPSHSGSRGTLEMTMRLWHTYYYCSQSFFDSPRGRWWMRLVANVAYLVFFMQVVFARIVPTWPLRLDVKVYLFQLFVVGFVVEAIEVVMIRFRGDLGKYISRHPFSFFLLLCDIYMMVLGVVYLLTVVYGTVTTISYDTIAKMTLSWCSMAVVVWLRVLVTLIPIFPRLGPLINTVIGMSSELFAFLVPWAFVIAGFGTALVSVFQDVVPAFNDISAAVLTLFTSFTGSFDYGTWDDGFLPYQRLWGQLMMLIFQGIVCILMINLLIAIIAYKYRPQEVQAQSEMNLAEIVDDNQFQVEHRLLCSPYSTLLLPFAWLPRGRRQKISVFKLFRFGLPFLDGFPQATPLSLTLPNGADELPHLVYLLTLHPLMMALVFVLYFLHAPYCVLYFACKGYKKAWGQLRSVAVDAGLVRGSAGSTSTSISAMSSTSTRHLTGGSSRRGSKTSFGSLNMDILELDEAEDLAGDAEDPWARMLGGLTSTEGWLDVLRGTLIVVFAFLMGIFTYVVVIGTGYVVLGSLYAWLAAICISLYSFFSGITAGLRAALGRCFRRRLSATTVPLGSSSAPIASTMMSETDGSSRDGSGAGGIGSSSRDALSKAAAVGSMLSGPPSAIGLLQAGRQHQSLSCSKQQTFGDTSGSGNPYSTFEPYMSCVQVMDAVERVFGIRPCSSACTKMQAPGGAASGKLVAADYAQCAAGLGPVREPSQQDAFNAFQSDGAPASDAASKMTATTAATAAAQSAPAAAVDMRDDQHVLRLESNVSETDGGGGAVGSSSGRAGSVGGGEVGNSSGRGGGAVGSSSVRRSSDLATIPETDKPIVSACPTCSATHGPGPGGMTTSTAHAVTHTNGSSDVLLLREMQQSIAALQAKLSMLCSHMGADSQEDAKSGPKDSAVRVGSTREAAAAVRGGGTKEASAVRAGDVPGALVSVADTTFIHSISGRDGQL